MIIGLENNNYLNISVQHRNGRFCVYVRKEFVEEHELDGLKYQTVTSTPFADGNFLPVEHDKTKKHVIKVHITYLIILILFILTLIILSTSTTTTTR